MSDGALRIPITGDASQFKATLAEIESSLKYFKEKLKSAKGDQVAKINFTIAGLEESKTAITTFGKFAEGTLGALNQQISELNRKKLTIQADAAALAPINQELDRLIKKRDELNKAGLAQPIIESVRPAAESIAGLRLRIQELNDLKILIDPKLNPSALAKINQEIDILEDKVSNLDNLGNRIGGATGSAAGGLKKFEDQSRQSRIAVTNLALVLQDLPFGFIAIQNNLPNLQSSFANLKTTSDGTKNAFKSFAGALAGPGGFFLAFSAVTAAVTYAIQKYGSLGNAVDALFGKYYDLGEVVNRASESLTEFNKNSKTLSEISGQAAASQAGLALKARALANTVVDLTKSENVRKNALYELKKLDEDRFKSYDVGKGKVDGLIEATKEYTRALIAQATASKFADEVSGTSVELEKQRNALSEVFKQLDKYGDYEKRLKDFAEQQRRNAQFGGESTYIPKDIIAIEALLKKKAEQELSITQIVKRYEELAVSANNATDLSLSLSNSFTKVDEESKKAANGVNKLKKAVKDLDIAELERQGRIAAFKLEEQAYKNRLKAVEDNIKAEKKLFDEIENRFEADALEADKLTKKVAPNASIERATEPLAEVQRQYQLAFTAINQTFFEPLQNLFETFLNTGKFTFKEFTKSVLKSITSIVSKLLATGVITALMNLLNPGGMLTSFAGGFGGGGQGANPILSALGNVFGAQPRRPDFNGIRPQGGGRGGEKVEFQIRGTNLVGVLNRANGEINRIG